MYRTPPPEEFLTVCRELGYTVGAVSRKGYRLSLLTGVPFSVNVLVSISVNIRILKNDYQYEHEADKQPPRKGENKPCHEVKQSHDKRQGEKPPCGGGEK